MKIASGRMIVVLALIGLLPAYQVAGQNQPKRIKVLIVDGRNNHDWRLTTDALRSILKRTGQFDVHVSTAPQQMEHAGPRQPRDASPELLALYQQARKRHVALRQKAGQANKAHWDKWRPDFAAYDAVILNYNGTDWPQPMRDAFVKYVRGGGGVVLVHAANNAFRNWKEFNDIIGLGWRPAGFGKALKIDAKTGGVTECCADKASGHGSKHPFQITVRKADHPIMAGIRTQWMHGKDELYHHMRGPAQNVTILSSAYSDPKQRGTGMHEPMTWETSYGKGRVIVTSMGHFWPTQDYWDSLYCVGFQTILARSAQYVATGKVTLDVPANFPGPKKPTIKAPSEMIWTVAGKRALTSEPVDATWKKIKQQNVAAMLTAAQERASFELPDGFVAELVASEPAVQEPVLTVWDGNGAMYVAEMRSYMQDEKGTGTKTLRNGRIKRLVDTTGDGLPDKVTIFVDGLNLPRMILPLDDRIAVVETDSASVWSYCDTNNDGVADEKKLLWEGPSHPPTKSVEHQDSGLIWNLDNWIYISYGHRRYRFTDGKWLAQKLHHHWGQWGLDRDDVGRVIYSGNSEPAKSFQIPRQYWSLIRKRSGYGPPGGDPLTLGVPYDLEFLEVRNICPINDRGGKAAPIKAFTSACGQSVFRGHAWPGKAYGDYFVCDPTIHAVRRAWFEDVNGKLMLNNAHWGEEFMISSDVNFRPINTATGPDGCLYVTDMYRGIIQDAPWLSEGPRKFIKGSGLSKNIQHGRIWRIRHADHKPDGAPQMLDETTVQLLRHLRHPNGWWRDTAQKLIILRKDRDSVAPLLEDIVRFDDRALARMHALWTLEGIGRVDRTLLRHAYKDRDPRVRAAAIQISEPLIEKGEKADGDILDDLAGLVADRDPSVGKQLVLSLGMSSDKRATGLIEKSIQQHITHAGVRLAGLTVLWGSNPPIIARMKDGSAFAKIGDPKKRIAASKAWLGGIEHWSRGLRLPKDMPAEHAKLIKSGEQTYYRTCVTCHAADGKGVKVAGLGTTLAPPLVGSPRVKGEPDRLIPILLHGLTGPVDGKKYEAGNMVPVSTFGIKRDDRIAEVITYIRYSWGNKAGLVTKDQVKAVRKAHADRKQPWTIEQLKQIRNP